MTKTKTNKQTKNPKLKFAAYIGACLDSKGLTGTIPNLLTVISSRNSKLKNKSFNYFPSLNVQPLGTDMLSQKAASGKKKKRIRNWQSTERMDKNVSATGKIVSPKGRSQCDGAQETEHKD